MESNDRIIHGVAHLSGKQAVANDRGELKKLSRYGRSLRLKVDAVARTSDKTKEVFGSIV